MFLSSVCVCKCIHVCESVPGNGQDAMLALMNIITASLSTDIPCRYKQKHTEKNTHASERPMSGHTAILR